MSETEQVDWAKVTLMQETLNEAEAEKLERVKIFDPKMIVQKAKDIREVFDKDLKTIRYVLLSYNDLNEIQDKCKDNRDRSIQLLLRQLQPANPTLTEKDVRDLPYEVVVRLLVVLQTEGSFFPRKPPQSKPLVSGSASTLTPKTSA